MDAYPSRRPSVRRECARESQRCPPSRGVIPALIIIREALFGGSGVLDVAVDPLWRIFLGS